MLEHSYEAFVFGSGSMLKRVIQLSCRTDTEAVMSLVRIGVGDFQNVAIWRGQECIYGGRDIKQSALKQRQSILGAHAAAGNGARVCRYGASDELQCQRPIPVYKTVHPISSPVARTIPLLGESHG